VHKRNLGNFVLERLLIWFKVSLWCCYCHCECFHARC